MPEVKFTKPCKHCPFSRDSAPGWLGSAPPESFTENALADFSDEPLPCHDAIDYKDPDWRETQYPNAPLCAGALIFARNLGKAPRDPERYAAINQCEVDRETVFDSPQEFIDHHRNGDARSWEF